MESNLSILLKEYGLGEKEIKVYLFLVENKELTCYKIASETKIHRSTCYDILERLINKGFVSKIVKQSKNYYSGNNVGKILSNIKIKENLILSIIPELQKLEKKEETNVKFLENMESQKEFDISLSNLIKEGKISFCYSLSNGPSAFWSLNLLIERLIKEIKKYKKRIEYKGIWDYKLKDKDYIKIYKVLGENRFLDYLPTKATIVIYDEHIAFLFTSNGPKVIEIKNKMIEEEMKIYFNYLWKISKK